MEPDGVRSSDVQDIDRDTDYDDDDDADADGGGGGSGGKKDENWDDKPPTNSEAGQLATDEETSQEGGEENGDDGDWDDEGDKDAKLVDKDDDDDDGDNDRMIATTMKSGTKMKRMEQAAIIAGEMMATIMVAIAQSGGIMNMTWTIGL